MLDRTSALHAAREATALDGYLSFSQAGRRLDLSRDRIRQLVDAGRLQAISTPLGRLIDPAEVDRLQAERAGANRHDGPETA